MLSGPKPLAKGFEESLVIPEDQLQDLDGKYSIG